MDDRPNRRNKAAFSNFSCVVCTLPEYKANKRTDILIHFIAPLLSSFRTELHCFVSVGCSLNLTGLHAVYPSIIFTKFSLTNIVFCSLFDQDEITRLRTEVGALKEREGSLKLQVSPLV